MAFLATAVPPDCIPVGSGKGLATTGSLALGLGIFALVCLAAGILLLARPKGLSRDRFLICVLASVALLGTSLVGLSTPAQAATANNPCPPGYTLRSSGNPDPSSSIPPKSQPSKPAPAQDKLDLSEKWVTALGDKLRGRLETFSLKADGSSGRELSGEQLPNFSDAKATVRAYYNAPDGKPNLSSSPYISEITTLTRATQEKLQQWYEQAIKAGQKPAIVLDADDTTLMTYEMEDAVMKFNFTPQAQHEYLATHDLPATPGMKDLVNQAHKIGYTVIGLTGRAANQKDFTLRNLKQAGYQGFTPDLYFTKYPAGEKPAYLSCAKEKCSTVEFKAGTRRHLEQDLGYTVVLNVGDQWSDLQGGHALHTLKLPNITYYLPSPNLPETEAADRAAGMDPQQVTYQIAPKGSSGRTEGAEKLPNMDVVKATIRAYYNAPQGKASQTDSPYLRETKALTERAAKLVGTKCAEAKAHGLKPAAVFDADDTTLMTYDMEDSVMHFDFTHAKQLDYLTKHDLPATPGMVELVKQVEASGCTVIGLTGRADALKTASLRNLQNVGYAAFKPELFFTKYQDAQSKPAWADCDGKPKCSTAQFKTEARAHFEQDLGYTIIGNFGDQWTDFVGGHSVYNVKLPNPTY